MTEQKLYPHTKPTYVQSIDLIVRDLEVMRNYYQEVIGLNMIESSTNGATLGVGQCPMLTLELDGKARIPKSKTAGLFHIAFLLPTRQDLAHYYKHCLERAIPLSGQADHLVSEALYLTDPEGNGIEIYADRKPEEWLFDADGVVMDTIPLNTKSLLSLAPKETWQKMPIGSCVGHLHLQVGNIAEAENFFTQVMNLKLMEQVPGASFFASGDYHHHIATNIWNMNSSLPRQNNMSGLKQYSLYFREDEELQKVLKQLDNLQIPVANTLTGKSLKDPWGIELRLEKV